jgi:hypothetical protein
MFCARLVGTPLEYGTRAFNEIVQSQNVTIIPGTRSIVLVDIHQVGTSCGFSMPCYDFVSFRPTLNDFFEKRVKNEREGKREDGIERSVALFRLYSCPAPSLILPCTFGIFPDVAWTLWRTSFIHP